MWNLRIIISTIVSSSSSAVAGKAVAPRPPVHESEPCNDVDSVTVTIFIGGQPRDIGVFCSNQHPPTLMSNDIRLEVTFVSRSIRPITKGFRATYRFVEDFGIDAGEIANDMVCGFVFKTERAANGTFTSPNYPGLYPRNTECHYLFYGGDSERIHITFPDFDVEGIPPCKEDTQSDYVEFSNFNVDLMDRKMRRMCGRGSSDVRNEVMSDGSFFRVTFKSNDAYDATGFNASFQFRKYRDPYMTDGKRDRTREKSSDGASRSAAVAAFAVILRLQLMLAAIVFVSSSS